MATLIGGTLFAAQANAADSLQVYWVFFQDKGHHGTGELQRQARDEALALRFHELSPRTIARRQRVTGNRNVVDESDLAVSSSYIAQVVSAGVKIRAESRWLNAVSVIASHSQIAKIQNIAAVARIQKLPFQKRRRQPLGDQSSQELSTNTDLKYAGIDYGNAKAQLEQIGVPAAHDCGLRGKGVVIGVLDSGFDTSHVSLKSVEVLGARDFVHDDDNVANESNDPKDQHNHGTSVLSLIAGWDPGTFVGVAPEVSVLLAKTEDLSQEDVVEEDWYVEGLEWAEEKGADIATSSLGYLDWIEPEDLDGKTAITSKAVAAAVKRGLICLTAAGNSGPGAKTLGVPADAEGVITIGSVDLQGKISNFSSRGPTADGRIKPDLVAPGSSVWLAKAGGRYERSSGTSFATPLTAGIVALLFELDPSLTPESTMKLLRDTAEPKSSSPDSTYGWGLVDAMEASKELCECQDMDNDGHRDAECGGDDCDDSNAEVHPGAVEDCDDGIDNNCDEKVDQEDDDCEDSGTEEDTGDSEEESEESGEEESGSSSESSSESTSDSETDSGESDSSSEESSSDSGDASDDIGEEDEGGTEESDSEQDESSQEDDDSDDDDESTNSDQGDEKSEKDSPTVEDADSSGGGCSMTKKRQSSGGEGFLGLFLSLAAGMFRRRRKQ